MTESADAHTADEPDRPLVVGVDGSEISYQAVAWAAVDAVLHGRRLDIVTSATLPTGFGSEVWTGGADWVREDGERIVAEARRIAGLAEGPLEIRAELVFDPIIPTLIERSERAYRVVVGSRGRGAVRRALLGSVSSAVVQRAHCPVAVIPGNSATDMVTAAKPVVVGVDGTENSEPAIGVAFDEASRRKVPLIAVHTWSDISLPEVAVAGWDTVRESERAALSESLAGWREQYPDVDVRPVVWADRPARALLAESEHSQLVVVGSHGRGGFTGMLLGSTGHALLQSSECPVIVVRRR
ncbi:universal stress protein [Nocardia nova]|uniref:Universal stress protein n=1 Tax=Nocardia nova TaxID=37330 RepID=A0A2S6AA10_9NOCA|nr:universal stress protein [Nocardia nova]PPJ19492.1 universal stress protein [Nocardia nova]PPJ30352.1 universal stress protein [Nocardia nova]